MQTKKRIIGVRHRQKQSRNGEAKPTMLAIVDVSDPQNIIELPLKDEQDEIDWGHDKFPVKYRAALPADKPEDFLHWQLVWRKVKDDESLEGVPKSHIRLIGKGSERLSKVPIEFTGLQEGDTILMLAGGSGNLFAHLLAEVGKKLNAKVMRISAARAKKFRVQSGLEIDAMHQSLVLMYTCGLERFIELQPRHQDQVEIQEIYDLFAETMDARIACQLRLYQRANRQAFIIRGAENQLHLSIKDRYDALKANSKTLAHLLKEEKQAESEGLKLMERMPAYTRVLKNIDGVGPRIAMRILACIPDITSFDTASQFAAFCGTHVLGINGKKLQKGELPPDVKGVFPRKRRGEICDWKPVLRQGLFLLDDQFNRRPKSFWGAKRLMIKKAYRLKHPVSFQETVMEGGKEKKVWRYNDGHIQKMTCWKTLNKFCRFLFRMLKNLEKELSAESDSALKVA